ncbi:isoflavone 3'-hydroxylase-like [Abrus precatorius]|uniref:Isoflavone 3'-hydroxylase-like n=1 Tax=Abrus precatorius TaxID=3816 RepID=A0A8B8KSP4_ABRPR|nr:isoflavone 3'-hydroxylase-like [Abrus precatorius]
MAPLIYYSLISLVFILTLKHLVQRKRLKNLPPCPPTLPIIGNLHHLKAPLHRSLHSLSQKYGSIFSLWFGSRFVVVISSPTLAQECFTKHDIVLANRPRFLTGKYLFYNYTSMGSSSYGDHWRNLRRIITIDVLSTQRLNTFFEIRREETIRVLQKLSRDSSKGFTQVQLRPRLTEMTFNNMMRMISGKRYYGDDIDVTDAEEAKQFRDIISEVMSLLGANNKGDFLPLLRWFDFDGLEKRLKAISTRADAFLQGLVEEHRSGKHKTNTMIEHLLTMQKSQPEYYSDHIIKGLIQGMLLAGTDTTAVTVEWAISALLNHPEILKKAKDEIDTKVGQDRLVDESDIPNLPYLQNIVYETLRLYSPAPLLLPHYTSDDLDIGGFTIPRDTIVLINAWAIQRDPKTWSDAECFKPERFEKEGEANKLIPFGLGRRACPGLGLAYRVMGLTLGLLIQCFDWKRLNDDEIDMRENKGVAMPKLIPLEALCRALPPSNKLCSN